MIIVLNGPPGSGKDAAVPLLEESLKVIHFSTSESLKLAGIGALGLIEANYSPADFESVKDEPNELFNDLSPREYYVGVAEGLKAKFGHDFWTKTLIRKIKMTEKMMKGEKVVYLITGMGFPIEMACFENDKKLADRVILVRTKRPGKTFGKKPGYEDAYGDGTGIDSRNWLFSDTVKELEVDNVGTLQEYKINLLWHLNRVMDLRKYASDRNDKDIGFVKLKTKMPMSDPLTRFQKPYRIYLPGEVEKEIQANAA